jgi:hypothetical protein
MEETEQFPLLFLQKGRPLAEVPGLEFGVYLLCSRKVTCLWSQPLQAHVKWLYPAQWPAGRGLCALFLKTLSL